MVLTNDKMPVLFTIIIGLIAFQINKIYDTLLLSPILEYNFRITEDHSNNIEKSYKIKGEIFNITRNHVFRDLSFDIRYVNTDTSMQNIDFNIEHPDIIPVAPTYLNILADSVTFSDGSRYEKINLWRNTSIRLNISELQPHMRFFLEFDVSYNSAKKRLLPVIYFDGKIREDIILLKERSIETFIVKNQIFINVILIFIWITIMPLFFVFSNSKNKTEES